MIDDFMGAQAIDVSGVADLALYPLEFLALPDSVREDYGYAVSFGLVLSRGILETVREGPNPLYLHHYRQLNYKLDMTGYLLARAIEEKGFKALPFAASQLVDWQNQKGHISHKKIAEMAGLGWLGRNNLLIHPKYGARVRYNTVLTDLPLAAAAPVGRGCGTCRACVARCPAGAIHDDPKDFDHTGCYEMLNRFRKERNIGHHICGICIEACKGER